MCKNTRCKYEHTQRRRNQDTQPYKNTQPYMSMGTNRRSLKKQEKSKSNTDIGKEKKVEEDIMDDKASNTRKTDIKGMLLNKTQTHTPSKQSRLSYTVPAWPKTT